jgi:hypothetical protein
MTHKPGKGVTGTLAGHPVFRNIARPWHSCMIESQTEQVIMTITGGGPMDAVNVSEARSRFSGLLASAAAAGDRWVQAGGVSNERR